MGRTASDLKRAGWPEKEIVHYQPWLAIERYTRDGDLKTRKEQALEIGRRVADMLKKNMAQAMLFFSDLWPTAHGSRQGRI